MLLVTGATGQLGRRVLTHLLNRIPPATTSPSPPRPLWPTPNTMARRSS
jgi:uncharacterized protein YbjT (DUF2867 family)